MKKSQKILISIMALILFFIGGFLFYRSKIDKNNTPVLKLATAPGFKPFEYTSNGKIVGFDIDLAQEVAKDMGRRLVIEETNFDGLIATLQAGKVDMVAAGMTVTTERAKNVDFSNPYYLAGQMIIVQTNNNTINSKDDLRGKKVGVESGTTGDELVRDMIDVERVQFPAVPAVLQELRAGRIDAVVLDNAPATIYAQTIPDIKILDNKLSEESYAIAINKNQPDLLGSINKTIARLKNDGTYEEMIKKHFGGELSKKMTFKEIFMGQQRYMYLIKGLGVTMLIAIAATLIGSLIGLIIVLMRISNWRPLRKLKSPKLANFNPLEFLAKFYTTIIRGTPLLVQLLIIYYVIFGDYQLVSKIMVAIMAFSINSGAYIAELFRAGFESIPKGQWEASRSLGLNYWQTIIYVTLPQAFKNTLPSLISEFITLIKETAIVGWIGIMDLMRGADNIRFETATAFESLIVVALIYLSLTTVFTALMGRVERKLKVDDRN